MRVCNYDRAEVASFGSVAWPLLAADPVRHTDSVTVLDALLRARADPARIAEIATLLTVHDGGALVGAVLRTAGRPALVSAVRPEHAEPVDRALGDLDPELPGVTGLASSAEPLAAAHAARTGVRLRVDMRMRVFALGSPTPVCGVPGAARRATSADVDLLAGWLQEFRREAIRRLADPLPVADRIRRGLAAGDALLIWEVDDRPVALAMTRPPIAGMSRIGPVYTPLEHRRHGFGAAVTAAAVDWALAAGASRVVLFVDQANPTSNRLYQRLGFRPAHDSVELSFRPPR